MSIENLIILDCEQGSQEWLEARKGIPTGTGIENILTNQGKRSSGQTGYMAKLLSEHIGWEKASYTSKSMDKGVALESQARMAYEFETGNDVIEVGGVYLNDQKNVMISPDGLIPQLKKGLEIKCPEMPTHISYCLQSSLPSEYKMQVMSGLWVTGYEAWDFVSYCPEWTPQPLFILTIERDEELIAKIDKEVKAFNKTLSAHKELIHG